MKKIIKPNKLYQALKDIEEVAFWLTNSVLINIKNNSQEIALVGGKEQK